MSREGDRQQLQLLFSLGANSYGQLGLGSKNDQLQPQQVPRFPDGKHAISRLAGGGGHSAAITDTGALYVCGQNRDGQLGLSHTDDVSHFSLCSSLQSERVSTVSCGWDFTIILTDSGRVLSCGSNAFGQLGIPHVKSSSVPEPVQSLQEKVLDISAGLRHSLALTDSGGVFQWGVGLASHAKRFSCGNPVPPFLTAKEPSRIPGLENVKGRKVIAGSYHSVTVTEDGDLYVWGSNKHGQLLQKETFVLWPQRIEPHFFSGERIRSAWSGWTHLVAQTDSGKVYTWGRADYGQLGREKEQPQDSGAEHFPKPLLCIPHLTGADQITCGSQHNLAVCGTAVYSWGWNEHGMCGDGTETNVEIPTQISIPAPHPATVKLIACGAGHSMILCVNPVHYLLRTIIHGGYFMLELYTKYNTYGTIVMNVYPRPAVTGPNDGKDFDFPSEHLQVTLCGDNTVCGAETSILRLSLPFLLDHEGFSRGDMQPVETHQSIMMPSPSLLIKASSTHW